MKCCIENGDRGGGLMDIVDLLLESHETLRGSLKSLTAMLGRPAGVGWEDRMGLDRARFSLQLEMFLAAFKAHEAVEDAYLSRIVRQLLGWIPNWTPPSPKATVPSGR